MKVQLRSLLEPKTKPVPPPMAQSSTPSSTPPVSALACPASATIAIAAAAMIFDICPPLLFDAIPDGEPCHIPGNAQKHAARNGYNVLFRAARIGSGCRLL